MDFFFHLPVDCENIKDKEIPHLNFKSLAISVLAKTFLMLNDTNLVQPGWVVLVLIRSPY